MRRFFVAGNWKMHGTLTECVELARQVRDRLAGVTEVDVAVCPPFPYLVPVGGELTGSPIGLGAQNCYHELKGAYTGEVSPTMLVDCGCRYVILGHSERRHILGETDDFIRKKLEASLGVGLTPILCVGETLEEREGGKTMSVVERQVRTGLEGLPAESLRRIVIAYEPVWAIGTGRNATPEQAQEVHAFIRELLRSLGGDEAAQEIRIQYGGSVKPGNAASLLEQPDVDGALVGGASLDAGQFAAIVGAAADLACQTERRPDA